ncbi:hypothetical protein, partial [Vibrio parahaemolyticus]|uniref:hypothetical protein n=1 Tax=Vibrio parahaemolyticus TaxID=670 RepID=UPI0030811D9C
RWMQIEICQSIFTQAPRNFWFDQILTHFILPKKANALLRCEQHNTEASANYLEHKTQRIAKMPSVANHS